MKNQNHKRIIIFDDDEDILDICKLILQLDGWDVFTFIDVDDVVARTKEIRPSAILMDNWIPNAGGIAATQALKRTEEVKDIPVIFFSANNDVKSLSLAAGAESYLLKPFDLDAFKKAINAVLPAADS
jgi:DNA-binding response OmpR family regulator